MPVSTCEKCGKTFGRKSNYNRHLKTHQAKVKLYFCDECSKGFVNKSNLKQHLKSSHNLKKMNEKVASHVVSNKGTFVSWLNSIVKTYPSNANVILNPISYFNLNKGVKPVEMKTVATQTENWDVQEVVQCACQTHNQSNWKKNLMSRHQSANGKWLYTMRL